MPTPLLGAFRISASIMCADSGALAAEVALLEEAGADMVHFDIMDARFVPNMPLGLKCIADLRARTQLPFDVHLMVADNDFFVREVAKLGASRIAIHAESAVHLDRSLGLIRDLGAAAGAALNPHTPISVLEYVLERLDFILLMSVNPGFAGQRMVPSAVRKVRDASRYLASVGGSIEIAVDGNVGFENAAELVRAGARTLVGGSSSLYRPGGSRRDNTLCLREAAARGLGAARAIERDDGSTEAADGTR